MELMPVTNLTLSITGDEPGLWNESMNRTVPVGKSNRTRRVTSTLDMFWVNTYSIPSEVTICRDAENVLLLICSAWAELKQPFVPLLMHPRELFRSHWNPWASCLGFQFCTGISAIDDWPRPDAAYRLNWPRQGVPQERIRKMATAGRSRTKRSWFIRACSLCSCFAKSIAGDGIPADWPTKRVTH